MRKYFVFLVLGSAWLLSKIFWRREKTWVGDAPYRDPWSGTRVLCFLNHTSLFEWLFIAMAPPRFLWRVACHGVIPAAEKTTSRPIVGQFFKLLGAHVVSISRERDHTWREVLTRIDPDSMVVILPEGRMMRANGLDSKGQPMTVRGGIADILETIPSGPMLLAYSGGLHHVQAPGESLPRPFRRIRMNFELVEISAYREARMAEAEGPIGFKRAVVDDLERRRNLYCPK
ncbi:MAG: 1-acyl-sn-glycerol-3-phosphate acyltransferase [Thermoanaerobaculia bacterium]